MPKPPAPLVAAFALAAGMTSSACGLEPAEAPPDAGGDAGGPDAGPVDGPFGGERPVEVIVPDGDDGTLARPLVLLLHGYGGTGAQMDQYLRFGQLAAERGFVYAHPEGTVDTDGKQFWSASNACCDFLNTGVDDSAYLSALITEIEARVNIDPKQVFLVGHSNGGFMTYRMACDHADQIAAFASVAGAMLSADDACALSEGVAGLHIHGTADETILFGGGNLGGVLYPGAEDTALQWAVRSGCGTATESSGADLDLDSRVAGVDTVRVAYAEPCDPGAASELWTTTGGVHIPNPTPDYMATILDWLFAHPKPQ